MKRFFSSVALALSFVSVPAFAQTAYRCDINGQTVYSEKPCVDGKAIAPTQDSDAQKKQASDAAKRIRDDDKAVNQRIADRSKEEAKERSEIRKQQIAADKQAAKERAKAEKEAKKKAKKTPAKMKVAKAPKPKTAKKKDNRAVKPQKA